MTDFLRDAQFSEQTLAVVATYDSFSPTSGSLLTQGGLGVKLSAHVGEQLTVNSVNITPSLGDIVYERQETLQNDITIPEPISNFIFYNNKTQSFNSIISVDVINTSNPSLNKSALWQIDGNLNSNGWFLNNRFTGDITGVRFYITNTTLGSETIGQINYTNQNSSGTTTTIRFKANTISPSGASNDAGPYASIPVNLEATSVDYTVTNINDWTSSPNNMQQAIDNLAASLSVCCTLSNELYVSKNGNDTTGNGSMSHPYLTVNAALTNANLYADNTSIVINIAAGQYTENLEIIKPNICLKGSSSGFSKITRINGSVLINPRSSSGGMYANYYTFDNIAFIGSANYVLNYVGNHAGYVITRDCMFYTATTNVKGLYFTNTTSIKLDMFKTNIQIATGGNQSAIYTNPGSAVIGSFYSCNIYGRVAPTISVSGTTNMSFNDSYIDNTGSDVVELKNTNVIYFTRCTLANYQLDSNLFNISNATTLVLSHCIFNLPTSSIYNPLSPGSPPVTTVGYVVKGPASLGANVLYGACLFTPISAVGSTYYWGCRSISNTVITTTYNTSFTSQS